MVRKNFRFSETMLLAGKRETGGGSNSISFTVLCMCICEKPVSKETKMSSNRKQGDKPKIILMYIHLVHAHACMYTPNLTNTQKSKHIHFRTHSASH